MKGAKTLYELLLGRVGGAEGGKKPIYFFISYEDFSGLCVCVCAHMHEQKPAKGIQSFMPRQFRNSHGIRIVKLLLFKKAKFWATASLPSNTKQPPKVTVQGMKMVNLF